MPQALVFTTITCPSCYSECSVEVDISAGPQEYYEDCEVCCAPMALKVQVDDQGELVQVDVQPGNS